MRKEVMPDGGSAALSRSQRALVSHAEDHGWSCRVSEFQIPPRGRSYPGEHRVRIGYSKGHLRGGAEWKNGRFTFATMGDDRSAVLSFCERFRTILVALATAEEAVQVA